jgi:hypothetical protein
VSNDDEKIPARTTSGTYIVLAMIAAGLMTGISIWLYWKLNLSSHLPLKQALAAEFKNSTPRVEIGKEKRWSPRVFRLIMKVDYTPTEDDPRVQALEWRVIELARQHEQLDDCELLVIHLVHRVPEKNPELLKIERKMADVLAK